MIGPEGAAQALTEQLEAQLPAKLAELRTRLTVEEADLPDPGLVEPHDRIRRPIEAYPAVLVLVTGLGSLTPVDRPDSLPEVWVARYPFRIYLWLRGEYEDATDLLRKRYVLAVREVLLARRVLATAVQGDSGIRIPAGDTPAIDPIALREDYSPIALDENGATVAAAYVEAACLIAESVEPDPVLGTAGTLTVEEVPLAHPAL